LKKTGNWERPEQVGRTQPKEVKIERKDGTYVPFKKERGGPGKATASMRRAANCSGNAGTSYPVQEISRDGIGADIGRGHIKERTKSWRWSRLKSRRDEAKLNSYSIGPIGLQKTGGEVNLWVKKWIRKDNGGENILFQQKKIKKHQGEASRKQSADVLRPGLVSTVKGGLYLRNPKQNSEGSEYPDS